MTDTPSLREALEEYIDLARAAEGCCDSEFSISTDPPCDSCARMDALEPILRAAAPSEPEPPAHHLTDGNLDAVIGALSGTFPIYADPEAGADLEGDAVTILDHLRDGGYIVVRTTPSEPEPPALDVERRLRKRIARLLKALTATARWAGGTAGPCWCETLPHDPTNGYCQTLRRAVADATSASEEAGR